MSLPERLPDALRAVVLLLVLLPVPRPARACDNDKECKGSRVCENHACVSPRVKACTKDTECPGEQICQKRACTNPPVSSEPPPAAVEPRRTVAPPPQPDAPTSPARANRSSEVLEPRDVPVARDESGTGTDRNWVVAVDAYSMLTALLSGLTASPVGLLLSVPLRIDKAIKPEWSAFVGPAVAYTSWNGLDNLALSLDGGAKYWVQKTVLDGLYGGARIGAGAQILGGFGLDLHALAELGYALVLGPFSISANGGLGIMIPIVSPSGSSRVGSDASTTSPSLMLGINIYTGVRF